MTSHLTRPRTGQCWVCCTSDIPDDELAVINAHDFGLGWVLVCAECHAVGGDGTDFAAMPTLRELRDGATLGFPSLRCFEKWNRVKCLHSVPLGGAR